MASTALPTTASPAPLDLPASPHPAAAAAGAAGAPGCPAARLGPLRQALGALGWLATLALALLTLGIVAIAALPAIGAQLLVVTSGSMAPAISAGDAVIVVETAPGDLDAGDIIAFRGYGRDRLTTHRVISRHDVGGRLHFRTQGDANAAPDPDLAPAEGVVGEAVVTLPGLGPWLLALTRPVPRLLLVVGPAVVVVLQIRDLVVAQPGERRAGPAPSRSIRPPAPCR